MEYTMNEYYVWQDNLMEETFVMLKHELDNDYPALKAQLEKEKNVLHSVLAASPKEALNGFHKSFEHNEDDTPAISVATSKIRLH